MGAGWVDCGSLVGRECSPPHPPTATAHFCRKTHRIQRPNHIVTATYNDVVSPCALTDDTGDPTDMTGTPIWTAASLSSPMAMLHALLFMDPPCLSSHCMRAARATHRQHRTMQPCNWQSLDNLKPENGSAQRRQRNIKQCDLTLV
jgi:hypothetical protein